MSSSIEEKENQKMFKMFRTFVMAMFVVFNLISVSHANEYDIYDVDINQAFRVYDKYTGELILDVAFEPVLVKGEDYEYVIMTVCDMHGYCAAYEFENRILLEKLNPEDIIR